MGEIKTEEMLRLVNQIYGGGNYLQSLINQYVLYDGNGNELVGGFDFAKNCDIYFGGAPMEKKQPSTMKNGLPENWDNEKV